MSELPTISELRANEDLLRRTVAAALEEGPWEHISQELLEYGDEATGLTCEKCNRSYWMGIKSSPCLIPDPATGSMADMAYKLVLKLCHNYPFHVIATLAAAIGEYEDGYEGLDLFKYWISSEPLDHVLCCLLALGKARLDS